jgi:DNA polymerase-3 subunit alpha
MAQIPQYIHLRTHTEYSLLEGAIRLKSLPEMCAQAGMPAVAVTDTNNMFCALEFSEYASSAGIQPIIGCQMDFLCDGLAADIRSSQTAPIILLVQNEIGYKNLLKLNSRAYLSQEKKLPWIDITDLKMHSMGLICLTGGSDGPVGALLAADKLSEAKELLNLFAEIFPNRLYVEIQRHPETEGLPQKELLTENHFIEFAYELNLPLVATNDVFFPNTVMYEAHDALMCIASGSYVDQKGARRQLTRQHYFKSSEEMITLFADLPEAIKNTVEIARRCAFKAETRDPILPKYAENETEELRRQAIAGLTSRLEEIELSVSKDEYYQRLDFELDVIEKMGFPGYFLIVADFIKWAKAQKIPVGPGRGSGAGSLVAYALTITDLDPLRYSLLFERFLNPERVSMPDFDIDFCMDRREEVINYVQQKYGKDKVGQIITFGALLSKAAIRDIGRVLQMPYGQVDRLAKLIPLDGVRPLSVEKAIEQEPRLREESKNEEVVARLLDYATQVEGLLRNASTHAAGIVIGDRPLDELVPLYQDPRSTMVATQFNMKWVESSGLVKFDFLGLKTLTVIQNSLELLKLRNIDVNIVNIPLDDVKTFELYASAKTVAVFQVESSGMMDALRRMKPTCIEDIVALVALYRPGPMENIPNYCAVKNGKKELVSIHPLIDHILAETQGIIVYQEQVMEIAQIMAGYTLGGADLLRRAMGKKIKEAMDAERPKFIKGASQKGVDANKASEIFDLLEKFANYGFNKSHAAAYAVVSYQTAWLKANYPVEFMAGVMNCDIHLTDKLAVYKEEVTKKLNIEIIPPCVNRSVGQFSVKDYKLIYGLGALKNVGMEAMQLIVDAREQGEHQAFRNLFDFARRVDMRKIGKRPLEMLVKSGAFDQLDLNRSSVLMSLDGLVAYSCAIHEQRSSMQTSLFGEAGADLPEPRLNNIENWLPSEQLVEEHQAIGFYLSGHPIDDYASSLKRSNIITISELEIKAKEGPVLARMAGSISGRQDRKSARGNRYSFVQVSDPTGLYEITIFSDVLEAGGEHLFPGSLVVMSVEAILESEQLKLLCRSVQPINSVKLDVGVGGLKIFVESEIAIPAISSVFKRTEDTQNSRNRGPVSICLMSSSLPGEVELDIGDGYLLNPQVKSALIALSGVVSVEEC